MERAAEYAFVALATIASLAGTAAFLTGLAVLSWHTMGL